MDINNMAPRSGNMLDAEGDKHNLLESFTGATKVMDNDHVYIHLGKRFTAFYKATIAAGQTLQMSFKTPTTSYVHFRGIKASPSVDKVDIDYYEGATINVAGTALTPVNRRRVGTPGASGVELKHGTTFSANGDLLGGLSEYLPGSTGTGTIRNGEGNDAAEEVVLKPNTVYRIVITNGSSASNIIGLKMNWYEETGG